jgi:hypothetical protein
LGQSQVTTIVPCADAATIMMKGRPPFYFDANTVGALQSSWARNSLRKPENPSVHGCQQKGERKRQRSRLDEGSHSLGPVGTYLMSGNPTTRALKKAAAKP